MPPSGVRKLSPTRTLVILGMLILVVAIGVPLAGRVIFASWSIGLLNGGQTLTGDWIGTMRAKQGAEFGLFLRLAYKPRSSRPSRSRARGSSANLEGSATICTPTGDRHNYEVGGYASPGGTVEKLWLEYGDPKSSALNLRMSGEWRAPQLRLQPDANPFLPDGRFNPSRALSSDDPDHSFAPIELVPGTIEQVSQCRTR